MEKDDASSILHCFHRGIQALEPLHDHTILQQSLPLTTVPRHPPITQQSVVLCSMLMFRMGKEARKQSPQMFNPYEPVPIPALLQMTFVFVLFMAMIIFWQAIKKNDSHHGKVRERLRQRLQSTFKVLRSTDVFAFLTALFG